MIHEDLGFVGNIWVRQNNMELAGDTNGGHAHEHDHVTLLVRGSVEVKCGDYEPKSFTAPTFIVIRRGLRHHFTALENDTMYYCVFALRDVHGDPTEILDNAHVPYSLATQEPFVWQEFCRWREQSLAQPKSTTPTEP